MLLESGKIYSKKHYINRLLLPSLQITDGVDVYFSVEGTKPNSISDMIKINKTHLSTINSILAMVRWIAVVYNNEDDKAYEMGLVEYPFITRIQKIDPEETNLLVDDSNVLLASENISLSF